MGTYSKLSIFEFSGNWSGFLRCTKNPFESFHSLIAANLNEMTKKTPSTFPHYSFSCRLLLVIHVISNPHNMSCTKYSFVANLWHNFTLKFRTKRTKVFRIKIVKKSQKLSKFANNPNL